MACKGEDDDRETTQRLNRACPVNDTNRTSASLGIPNYKVINDQYNQISHRDQCRDTGIFEGVQASKVGERYYN